MTSLRRWLYPLLALAALGTVLWWAFAPRPLVVETVAAVTGSVQQTVDEEGKTRVRDRFVVSAPVGGRLTRITLEPGDPVARDAVVASIMPAPPQMLDARTRGELAERVGTAQANVERAGGTVARSAATAKQAATDLARTENLHRQGFVSIAQVERERLDLEVARREASIAESQRRAAEHELGQTRAALASTTATARRVPAERFEVRSPVAGRVLRVVQESEAVVTPGTALLEIGDPRELEIVVEVLSADAVGMVPGSPVAVERWGGAGEVVGRVRHVEPRAFTKVSALGVEEQRVTVVVDLLRGPEAWARVGDGYRVLTRIRIAGVDSAVVIPVGALMRSGDSWQVFVIDGETARRRNVDVVLRNATQVALGSGVRAGERVVVYPPAALDDGRRVARR